MSAERKAIRAKVVELLKANPPLSVGDRVYANRATPLDEDSVPCILVYLLEEQAEFFDAPARFRRTCQVAVEAVVMPQGGDNPPAVDDDLDDLITEIEARLTSDERLGGVAAGSSITNIEFEFDGAGRQVLAGARIKLEVVYLAELPPDKTGTLDNFERANVQTDLAPSDGSVESEDQVELEQV